MKCKQEASLEVTFNLDRDPYKMEQTRVQTNLHANILYIWHYINYYIFMLNNDWLQHYKHVQNSWQNS